MEGAAIAKGPCKELKGLEFEVTLVWDVVEYKGCKVGLTGKGAEAGELRDLDMNSSEALLLAAITIAFLCDLSSLMKLSL